MGQSAPGVRGLVSVWIVEDDDRDREGLQRSMELPEDLLCEHAFRSAEQLFSELDQSYAPGVLLMDIGLPGMDGIEAVERLGPIWPATEVIMLTIHEDTDRIFRALCAGASGYLVKGVPHDKIHEAIRDVAQGGAVMSTAVARRVVALFARLNAPPRDYGLTAREKDVLDELCLGKQKQTMATDLGVSIHTVDTHLRSIYAKLHVNTQTGAVAKAHRDGLVGWLGRWGLSRSNASEDRTRRRIP